MHMDVAAALEAEVMLLDPLVRASRAAVEGLLDADFTELGRSGRLWTRDELLAAIQGFAPTADVTVHDVTGLRVADGVVLVTYVTERAGERTYRSSLWSRASGGWKILHHQASPLHQTAG